MNKNLGILSTKGDQILYNQTICQSSELSMPEGYDLMVYEVLRIIDHIPLFYDDHIKRLFHSCELVGKALDLDVDNLFKQLIELSRRNDFPIGNVMLNVVFDNGRSDLLAYFIPHHYPGALAYKNGVEVGLLHAERTNPEAKVVQPNVREAANELIKTTGVYEVLLVDKNLQLSEGSRSNLFCIRDNILFTAPLDKVLKGITLCKVLELAKELAVEVRFERFAVSDLVNTDALFITGTSPKILPVAKVEKYTFQVNHPVLLSLMNRYEELVQIDITEKRRLFR